MAAKKNPKAKAPAMDLAAIVAATAAGTFVYTSPEAHAKALADGLVEVNPSMANEAGELATRATQKGIESMNAPDTASASAPAPAAKSKIAIDDGATLTPVVGRGRGGETYPFEQLQVGQSFFVPNTADKPNIAKSLASTVSSATRRYATEIEGQTRVDRKGNTVPAFAIVRKFELRARSAEQEAAEGFTHGNSGARVYRTK